MRLVIDMQGLQTASRQRGIGRYTAAFVREVINTRGTHEVFLSVNGMIEESASDIRHEFGSLLDKSHIVPWYALPPVRWAMTGPGCRRRSIAAALRDFSVSSLEPDVVHISSPIEGFGDDAVSLPLSATPSFDQTAIFFDAIPKLYPGDYLQDPLFRDFYNTHTSRLATYSHLLAISETVRREAIDQFAFAESRVTNIGAGVDPFFSAVDVNPASDFVSIGIDRPFVLYTGGFDTRKNLPRLIDAYASLPFSLRESHQLAIVGDCHVDIVCHLRTCTVAAGLSVDNVVFPGYVSDSLLRRLYSGCKLAVLPSWHEGFGLPILEAMRCGAPVIGSRSSAIAELIDDSSALFDPFSVPDIAAVLEAYLVSSDLRDTNRRRGLARSNAYTWEATARKAWLAWESLRNQRDAATCKPRQGGRGIPIDAIAAEVQSPDFTNESLKALATAVARTDTDPQSRLARSLFVDISELSERDAKTGVQRVTRSILLHLLSQPPIGYRVIPVRADTEHLGYRSATSYTRHTFGYGHHEDDDILIEPQPEDIFLGLDLQHHVVTAQQPWLRWAHMHGVYVYFVIYDLLPLQFPDCFPQGTEAGHRNWLGVVTGFDGVLCISRSVAQEVSTWLDTQTYHRYTPRVSWFHLGADIDNSIPTKGLSAEGEECLRQCRARTTFLMVGTVEPRKGHGDVLDAFELLWAQGLDLGLAIVGKRGWNIDALASRILAHPEVTSRLFWVSGASDEFLQAAYSASDALLAFSLGEGFGLPLIEAAQYGIPIIARDIPVFREVAGAYATYVDATSPRAIATAITNWIDARSRDHIPKSANMPYLTWQESTAQLVRGLGINGLDTRHPHTL
jgi:glycosyltransferase involved in cell wall biosynthesis